jgi:hypothetical protein
VLAAQDEANFEGLQRFLQCVHTRSVERRLSRHAYMAEKPRETG